MPHYITGQSSNSPDRASLMMYVITPKTPLDGELPSSTLAGHYHIRYAFCCYFQRPVERNNGYRLTLKLDPVRVALKNINIIGIFFSAPLYEFADQRGSLYLNTLKSRPPFRDSDIFRQSFYA